MVRFISGMLLSLMVTAAFGQYWFGPKVGFHRVDHDYMLSGYKGDSFNIAPNYNFQAGFVMTYMATSRYAAHIEINYERISRRVQNIPNENLLLNRLVDSRFTSNYISTPFLFRVNFGRAPVHYYLNGGPKLNFWLGGRGQTSLEQFYEDRGDGFGGFIPEKWEIVFNPKNSTRQNEPTSDLTRTERLSLEKSNIVQYGLTLGGGANFDIRGGTRIMVDLRYSYGHSNMGFNGSSDFEWEEYSENWEYRHHTLSLSAAYLFEFDQKLARKGKSTNKDSNKKKKR